MENLIDTASSGTSCRRPVTALRVGLAVAVVLVATASCTGDPWNPPGPTTSSTSSTTSTTTTSVPPTVGAVTRVSAGGASAAVISRNGRYVAFVSTNSGPGADGNGSGPDVFLYDDQTATTTRVTGGNGASQDPSVSDTGVVVFRSAATDLAGADTNGVLDAFIWNSTDGITRVTDALADVSAPLISADGSTVAFGAPESRVAPGGSSRLEAFLWQPSAPGVFVGLSESGAAGASPVAISADGTRVLLAEPGALSLSEAPATAATVVATAPASPPAPQITTFSVAPHAIAADGDVVFAELTYSFDESTNAIHFISGVLKRWDRDTATATTIATPGVPGAPGGPVTSDDGTKLVVGDHSAVIVDQDAAAPYLPAAIRTIDIGGSPATAVGSYDASFGTVSADGRSVAFVSSSSTLDPPDPNGTERDVYIWERGS